VVVVVGVVVVAVVGAFLAIINYAGTSLSNNQNPIPWFYHFRWWRGIFCIASMNCDKQLVRCGAMLMWLSLPIAHRWKKKVSKYTWTLNVQLNFPPTTSCEFQSSTQPLPSPSKCSFRLNMVEPSPPTRPQRSITSQKKRVESGLWNRGT
jgi:hypothetical protein